MTVKSEGTWQSSDSVWCFSCGVEMTADDIENIVKRFKTFQGFCTSCMKAGEGF